MEIFNAQQKRTFSDSLVLRSQNFRVRLNLFIQNAVLVGYDVMIVCLSCTGTKSVFKML
jgi:hypothetical protein